MPNGATGPSDSRLANLGAKNNNSAVGGCDAECDP